jgi:hypothetical protein
MAAKTFIKPYKVLSSGDMSQSSLTSSITSIQGVDNVVYQFIFTGTPTGVFTIEVSTDYAPGVGPNSEPANPGHWVTLPVTPALVASGTDGSVFVDLNQMGSPYIRAVYTRTSGTGVLNIIITAKAI